jgi:dinuclear metal center YbgI/SA1388 family protein
MKTLKRSDVIARLSEYLQIEKFSDYCVNGLQVEGRENISRISTAVSVSERCIREAIRLGSDLLIVHHGMFWKSTQNPFALTGVIRNRLKLLLEADLNLAAYHLPLDAHPEIGNNIQICKALEMNIEGAVDVGWRGTIAEQSGRQLKEKLAAIMPDAPQHLDFGPNPIRSAAVVSGGASRMIEQMSRLNVDAYISGDFEEPVVRLAEELKIHFFAAGHYNTERFGPLALAGYIKSAFGLEADFIDIPNPA